MATAAQFATYDKRKRGTKNTVAKGMKERIANVFDKLNTTNNEYLYHLAENEPALFVGLVKHIIPASVHVAVQQTVDLSIAIARANGTTPAELASTIIDQVPDDVKEQAALERLNATPVEPEPEAVEVKPVPKRRIRKLR